MPNETKNLIDEKLFGISSKILAGLLTIIFTVGGIMYSDSKQRITILEDKVSFLYQDKISRTEFQNEMKEFRRQNDINKSDILERQENTKLDILARIDLIFPKIPR